MGDGAGFRRADPGTKALPGGRGSNFQRGQQGGRHRAVRPQAASSMMASALGAEVNRNLVFLSLFLYCALQV